MARVELAPALQDDFERILDHLLMTGGSAPAQRIGQIVHALDVLVDNPLIGRPIASGQRELVIGRRRQGYLALYHYAEEIDTVFVLAIRSQSEAGYSR